MLNSATKTIKYSNSRVARKQFSEQKKLPITPPAS